MPQPLIQTTGRRKRAVARVRLRPGTGMITVNKRPVEDYFPNADAPDDPHRAAAAHRDRRGLRHRRHHRTVAASAGQAGALRLGIARGLIELDPELRGDAQARPASSPATLARRNPRSTASRRPARLRSTPSADHRRGRTDATSSRSAPTACVGSANRTAHRRAGRSPSGGPRPACSGRRRVVIGRDTRRSGPAARGGGRWRGLAPRAQTPCRWASCPPRRWHARVGRGTGRAGRDDLGLAQPVRRQRHQALRAGRAEARRRRARTAVEAALDRPARRQPCTPAARRLGDGRTVSPSGAAGGRSTPRSVVAALEGRRLDGLHVVRRLRQRRHLRRRARGAATPRGTGERARTPRPTAPTSTPTAAPPTPSALQRRGRRPSGPTSALAFDGDADRVLAVDRHRRAGRRRPAPRASARSTSRDRGRCADDTVVVTVMTNLGFRQAMEAEQGSRSWRPRSATATCSRRSRPRGLSLGGEQSGHIIFRDLATTGDGLLTRRRRCSTSWSAPAARLAELAADAMTRCPQVLVNVAVAAPQPDIAERLARRDRSRRGARSATQGRVLRAPRGTEPLVRVMVEAEVERAGRAEPQRRRAVWPSAGPELRWQAEPAERPCRRTAVEAWRRSPASLTDPSAGAGEGPARRSRTRVDPGRVAQPHVRDHRRRPAPKRTGVHRPGGRAGRPPRGSCPPSLDVASSPLGGGVRPRSATALRRRSTRGLRGVPGVRGMLADPASTIRSATVADHLVEPRRSLQSGTWTTPACDLDPAPAGADQRRADPLQGRRLGGSP